MGLTPERVENYLASGGVTMALLMAAIVATVWAELAFPLHECRGVPDDRIRTNVVLSALNFAADALLPASMLSLVALTRSHGWGLLPALGIDGWAAVAISIPIVSAAQYWLHRLSHRYDLLWRVHRVHHSDVALDLTTTFRQHPFTRPLGVAYHSAIGIALGLAPLGLVLCTIMTLVWSIPQHADLRLSPTLDRFLAIFLATPAAHRLHHSARRHETDSNYAEVLNCWDRLFGTWRPTTAHAQVGMPIGLEDPHHASIGSQLLSPFRRP